MGHYHPAGTNYSAENPSPESHPGLKRTRMGTILKKLVFKMKFQYEKMSCRSV
jgi:hypothetical protein